MGILLGGFGAWIAQGVFDRHSNVVDLRRVVRFVEVSRSNDCLVTDERTELDRLQPALRHR